MVAALTLTTTEAIVYGTAALSLVFMLAILALKRPPEDPFE